MCVNVSPVTTHQRNYLCCEHKSTSEWPIFPLDITDTCTHTEYLRNHPKSTCQHMTGQSLVRRVRFGCVLSLSALNWFRSCTKVLQENVLLRTCYLCSLVSKHQQTLVVSSYYWCERVRVQHETDRWFAYVAVPVGGNVVEICTTELDMYPVSNAY